MKLTETPLRSLFFKHIAQTSDDPPAIEIASGEGCFLYDNKGKEYLDFISGISVSSLGHNNLKIQEAVIDQLKKHSHVMVFSEYILSAQVSLAQKLAGLLPPSLSSVYFTNSGAEAIEGAMKLSKRVTGKTKFVSCVNAYHGSTQGALSLMGNDYFKQAYRPLIPDIHFIRFNNISDIQKIDNNTAAVFLEPVQSETGYLTADYEFLNAIRDKCFRTGALLVFDEAQSGLGRTGKMFGFEHSGIVPDILVLAKALGGGFPLGAFISSGEKMNLLSVNPPLGHLTTFGGHPVSCTASLAAIEQIISPGFTERVLQKEELFRRFLSETVAAEKLTGKGLMLAIHLNSDEQCRKIITNCMNEGLLTDWFLFAPHALRIAPPLIIPEDLIERGCNIIIKAIANC